MKNNGILTIIKKEFSRFFGDRRLLFSTILLPGLLIYLIYSFMGSAMSDMFTVDADYRSQVYVENLPASMEDLLSQAPLELTERKPEEFDQSQELVENKEIDLLIRFPADFDAAVAAYRADSGAAAPNVELYYNSSRTESQSAYTTLLSLLDSYESALANKFDVNAGGAAYDLASAQDSSGQFFAMLLPMLTMILMFSGCMAVAPESIAGEKERGTIAALLVTPMKRSHLAIGKIVSLGLIALLSGLSNFLGTALSLPKLMGGAAPGMSAAAYSAGDYLLLVLVIFSTVLLMVALISLISAFAKTVKEASTAVMPLMVLVMVLGVTAMFGSGPKTGLVSYLIPLYNSVQAMVGIFSFSPMPMHILVTAAVNLLCTGLCIAALTKMFNSERIVFSK